MLFLFLFYYNKVLIMCLFWAQKFCQNITLSGAMTSSDSKTLIDWFYSGATSIFAISLLVYLMDAVSFIFLILLPTHVYLTLILQLGTYKNRLLKVRCLESNRDIMALVLIMLLYVIM